MTDQRIEQEAVAWLVRQHDSATDWAGFTAWLEADPRHRAIYEELALLDSDLELYAASIFTVEQDNERRASRRGRSWMAWGGGGAIAAAIAAIFLVNEPKPAPSLQLYATRAGETRKLHLSDGSTIALAPASSLTVRGGQFALNGAAYFDIRHRTDRTLTITAGEFEITDIGTQFAVSSDPYGFRVDVAEGRVTVRPPEGATAIQLTAGRSLTAEPANGSVRLSTIDPDGVAEWRSGRLRFDSSPLAVVVGELSRYSAVKVSVDPAIADRQFSGVIAIEHSMSPAQSLAKIMSIDAHPVVGGVRLQPRPGQRGDRTSSGSSYKDN